MVIRCPDVICSIRLYIATSVKLFPGGIPKRTFSWVHIKGPGARRIGYRINRLDFVRIVRKWLDPPDLLMPELVFLIKREDWTYIIKADFLGMQDLPVFFIPDQIGAGNDGVKHVLDGVLDGVGFRSWGWCSIRGLFVGTAVRGRVRGRVM